MKKIILIIGAGWITLGAFAQTKDSSGSYSFSLRQAIDYALQNQKDVKNAQLDEQIAKQKVKEIMGMGLPQINTSFDIKEFLYVPTQVIPNFVSPAIYAGLVQAGVAPADPEKMSPDGYPPLEAQFGTKYAATAGVDASQLLFSGEYFLGLKASKVFVELSSKSTERTKIEVSSAIAKGYYMVLVSDERMKLLDTNLVRLKKTLDDTKALMDNGFVEKLDYDRLTVTYNNLLTEQEKAKRMVVVGTYLLKYQMGMDINANLTLTDKLGDVNMTTEANASQKFDYEKRVEYGLFQTQYKLAKLDLKRQRLSYLPVAVAYGSVSGAAQRNEVDFFDTKKKWYPTSVIGAKISMPIFTGFQRRSKNQQAQLAVMKAENNMDFIKRSIDLELASAAVTLQNASASLEIQKKNIALAEDVVRVAKLKYDQGVGSNLELITAEASLRDAQGHYFAALYDALAAKVDYDKANGNLK
jgi:outer membrane protein TolC